MSNFERQYFIYLFMRSRFLGLVSVSPSIFQGTKHLEKLNLSSNLLTDLQPGLIEALPRLVSLDLSLNLFGGLEGGFFNSVSSSLTLEMVYLQGKLY